MDGYAMDVVAKIVAEPAGRAGRRHLQIERQHALHAIVDRTQPQFVVRFVSRGLVAELGGVADAENHLIQNADTERKTCCPWRRTNPVLALEIRADRPG